MSSCVIGNSQYCCCSSVYIGPGLQKAPVCSDPSKQLVWHVARQKLSQLTGSTYLSGRPPRELSFSVVRHLTHIQVALVFYHLKRNSGRNADCWEFSRPDDTHKGGFCAPDRGASWSPVVTTVSMTKRQVFRIDTYFLFLIIRTLHATWFLRILVHNCNKICKKSAPPNISCADIFHITSSDNKGVLNFSFLYNYSCWKVFTLLI